jgi:hypothetical protein
MDHREARDDLDAVLVAAQSAISGQWEIAESGADAGTIPSRKMRARYVLARCGDGVPPDQAIPVTGAIVEVWSEATFAPTGPVARGPASR